MSAPSFYRPFYRVVRGCLRRAGHRLPTPTPILLRGQVNSPPRRRLHRRSAGAASRCSRGHRPEEDSWGCRGGHGVRAYGNGIVPALWARARVRSSRVRSSRRRSPRRRPRPRARRGSRPRRRDHEVRASRTLRRARSIAPHTRAMRTPPRTWANLTGERDPSISASKSSFVTRSFIRRSCSLECVENRFATEGAARARHRLPIATLERAGQPRGPGARPRRGCGSC